MDRLVAVDLAELRIAFRPSACCPAAFTITNLMHTMSVAVHVSTTRPSLFSVSPSAPSLLPPLSSAIFTLILVPLDRPPVTSPPDLLTVRSALFTIAKPDSAAINRLFSRHGVHVFKDAAIPISLVGPHVLDTLLISSAETLGSGFLISKAVASCSTQDLSALLRRSAAARNPGFVAAMIAAGAEVDDRGSDRRSALSLAVSSGDIDAVRVLVDAGAGIDLAVDLMFHEAAAANRVDLITVLEKSGRVTNWAGSVDSGGRTPVHYAAANGHLEAVRVCLTSGDGEPDQADSAGWTPLHYAAHGGFLDVVEFLIWSSKFDPKIAVTFDGKKSPLDLAVEDGHSHLYDVLGLGDQLFRAVSVGDVFTVKECILSNGVAVNQRDQNGWTALHRAAFGGWIEIVKLLIENGARLDVVDGVGFTPLRCAVEAGHVEAALVLVGQGAQARLKGSKSANLFSMRLNSHGVDACNLLTFGVDNQAMGT